MESLYLYYPFDKGPGRHIISDLKIKSVRTRSVRTPTSPSPNSSHTVTNQFTPVNSPPASSLDASESSRSVVVDMLKLNVIWQPFSKPRLLLGSNGGFWPNDFLNEKSSLSSLSLLNNDAWWERARRPNDSWQILHNVCSGAQVSWQMYIKTAAVWG